jgi:CheY-like chemotaxis protein
MGSPHTTGHLDNPFARFTAPIRPPNVPGMSNDTSLRIVVIDDDRDHGECLAALLDRAGHSAIVFNNASAAIRHIERYEPDLVITDIFMPEMDGFEVLRHIKSHFPFLPILAMSGNLEAFGDLYLESIVLQGAVAALSKPFTTAELLSSISNLTACSNRTLQDAIDACISEFNRSASEVLLNTESSSFDVFQPH